MSVSSNPRYNELEDLTAVAEFVVEATHFEQLSLWSRWAKESREAHTPKLDWLECSRGWLETVGHVGKRSVCISIQGATLNGHHVLFYEATSELVDWKLIEKWFKKKCWPLYDNGTRRAHCDAMNFHLLMGVVEAHENEKR